MTQTILNIIMVVLTVGVGILSWYLYIRQKVKDAAIDSINAAQDDMNKVGAEKMDEAVNAVHSIIPKPFNLIFTKEILRQLIQPIYDQMKEFAIKKYGDKGE